MIFNLSQSCVSWILYIPNYRWVPLKLDFLGACKSVWLISLSGLSVLICIKLIKLYKNEIIQKIRAKRESGLTAVRFKRDPPVLKNLNLSCNQQQWHHSTIHVLASWLYYM